MRPTIPLCVATLTVGACVSVKEENKVAVNILADAETASVDREKVRPQLGEAVEWAFRNGSNRPIRLKVGNFRPHGPHPVPGEAWDKDPLEGGCVEDVTVASGHTAAVQCRVRSDAKRPRTYKYDIIGDGKVLLDPVLEIPPP
jgi:hypothetical protein